MDVGHGLMSGRTVVLQHVVRRGAGRGQHGTGDARQTPADGRGRFVGQLIKRLCRFLGNDQSMTPAQRVDVEKGENPIVLVHPVTGDVTGNDPGKDCLGHGREPISHRRPSHLVRRCEYPTRWNLCDILRPARDAAELLTAILGAMALRQKVRNNLGYMVFIASLVGLSGFFTYRVEGFRGLGAKARLTESIAAGAEVAVVDVIDGDEVVVKTSGGENFVVRLLGIKSFDPVVNDPSIGMFGRSAAAYLETELQDEQVTLEFEVLEKDSKGRVLAYVHKGDKDIGQDLVARGFSLVFVQFAFSRESAYQLVQAEARDARKGLWGDPRAVQRAQALLRSWRVRRGE